jgi:mycothiol synthase
MLFEVVYELSADAVDAVRALATQAKTAEGHVSIDDHRLTQATSGRAPGFVAALAWDERHRDLLGYVQAVRGRAGWDVERAMAPDQGIARSDLTRRLVKAALEALAVENGTDVRLWAYQAGEPDDRLAAAVGLHPARELRQMRRPLPVEGVPGPSIPTRPFEVGRDEQAWLEVNNRAFGWHPDQGGWTLIELQSREREPWFDPTGFLLHEREGRLVGFCWTKVHRDTEPPVGEIYVIAVDPDWHGTGLGRALTRAGLDHLAGSGLTVGMLYVEATNTPAVHLYQRMGFTVHHVDRVYRSLSPTG